MIVMPELPRRRPPCLSYVSQPGATDMKRLISDRSGPRFDSSVNGARPVGPRFLAWPLIAAISVLACGCSDRDTRDVWPDGLIGHTCGSNDAPLPVITSTAKDGRSVRLTVPDASEAEVVSASEAARADRGQARVYLCDSNGCELGTKGRYDVRAAGEGAWQFDFNATFVREGRPQVVHGSFIAHKADDAASMPCG